MESLWKGKEYFRKFVEENKDTPWYKNRNDSSGFNTMINRIRANHYNLNEPLGRKGIVNTKRCDCGTEKEDINHVLYKCRKYEEEREFMFGKMEGLGKRIICNVDKLI